jgi:hypothetical protein
VAAGSGTVTGPSYGQAGTERFKCCSPLVIERHNLLSRQFFTFLAPFKIKRSLHHVQYDYLSVFIIQLINIGVAKSIGLQIFAEDALFFVSY